MAADRFKDRFDGVKAFLDLPRDVQAAVGGLAVEIVYAAFGLQRAERYRFEAVGRAFDEAGSMSVSRLHDVVAEALSLAAVAESPMLLPSLLGPVCRKCGCSQHDACETAGGVPCHWIEDDLCSACIEGKA